MASKLEIFFAGWWVGIFSVLAFVFWPKEWTLEIAMGYFALTTIACVPFMLMMMNEKSEN